MLWPKNSYADTLGPGGSSLKWTVLGQSGRSMGGETGRAKRLKVNGPEIDRPLRPMTVHSGSKDRDFLSPVIDSLICPLWSVDSWFGRRFRHGHGHRFGHEFGRGLRHGLRPGRILNFWLGFGHGHDIFLKFSTEKFWKMASLLNTITFFPQLSTSLA